MTPPTIAPTDAPRVAFASGEALAVEDEVPVCTNRSLSDESAQVAGYSEAFVRSATAEGWE
jgi:hypothetical protein